MLCFLLIFLNGQTLATDFLQKYGYLPRGNNNQLSSQSLAEPLKSMQRMAGLQETGVLDERTMRMMEMPRCGHPDIEEPTNNSRGKRYAQQFKWTQKTITYGCKSAGPSTRVSLSDLRMTMHQAAVQWSELADVEIKETAANNPMIQISAGRSSHYPCRISFDAHTLAHAFFPPHGQIHINDNVRFSMSNYTEYSGGNSLFSVVAHEMGHALGFGHSPDSNSVMFAYDTPRKWQFTPMDKYNMQLYYGTKKGTPKVSHTDDRKKDEERRTEREEEKDDIRPDECRIENPVVVQYRGEYLVFKSQWVWRISPDWKRLISKAVPIDQLFHGVPSPIDSAVSVGNHLWLFVMDKIYVIDGNQILHAPFRLSELGINERSIDLAFEWHYFNPPAIYLWKGSRYWRLDEKLYYRRVDERYPKDIELNWGRVPKGVHSAFTYQKEMHFIRGSQVFRMNSSRSILDVADDYPKPFRSFFGFCPHNERLVSSKSFQIIPCFLILIFSFLI